MSVEPIEETLRADPAANAADEPSKIIPKGAFQPPASLKKRYESLKLIGEGAMGTVFQGWDPQLGRAVAIKILKGDEPDDTKRFLQEAKAQARVKHENVCRVYDAGMANGIPYIAMELIDGAPLDRAKEGMSLEQKVKVVREVAAALHEAHRLGLIHRDIKPSNIMIAKTDDGHIKPYVVDFGLARETANSDLTFANMLVGTPAYMSPEQAEGGSDALDRRSDVYSLGATLYELLAGRTPFTGQTAVAILTQLLLEEAPALSLVRPDVPSDLETIVMTCLQRDPSRRYESARALGEDLQRFLDGDPILARKTSLAYLLYTKAKKNKPAVLIAFIGLCATLVLAGMWTRASQRAAEQASLARELGEDVKYVELFLRSAYGFPPHDIEREKKVVRARLTLVERRMKEAGKTGEGPGHYAIGRGLLALHDYKQAQSHLSKALESGYTQPEVHYALGLTLGGLYQDALDQTRRIGDRSSREAAAEQAKRTYKDTAVEHLHAAGDTEVESKIYIDALIALYESRYDDAANQASAAAEESPWLYEAKKLEGDARLEAGLAEIERGQQNAARKALESAIQAYQTAADIATSDSTIHEALAEAWIQVLQLELSEGRPYADALRNAIGACEQALKANPKSANAYSKKARAYAHVGDRLVRNGEDPRPTLELAIESARAAKRIAPNDAISDDSIGNSYSFIAAYERKIGQDPLPSIARAMQSFDEATRIEPTFAWAWNDAGVALHVKTTFEAEHGLDLRPSLAQALERFGRAAREDPTYLFAYTNMAYTLTQAANAELMHGRDPRPDAQRAIENCDHALKLNDKSAYALNNRGWAELTSALYLLFAHIDGAEAALVAAAASFQRSMDLNRDEADTQFGMGAVCHARALYALDKGTDPQEHLKASRAFLKQAMALDAMEPLIRVELARLEMTAARYGTMLKRDAKTHLEEAQRVVLEGLQHDPEHAMLNATYADLIALREDIAPSKDTTRRKTIEAGFSAAKTALAQNPNLAIAMAAEGALYAAQAKMEKGDEKARDLRLAEESLEKALKTNPLLPAHTKELLAQLHKRETQ